jgi:hypothetical protein
MIHRTAPPKRKPVIGGNHTGRAPPLESSTDGANNDQYAAAIITPAANPSMALRKRLPTFLVRKTVPAPNAVIAHVNSVAINACNMGDNARNFSTLDIVP